MKVLIVRIESIFLQTSVQLRKHFRVKFTADQDRNP